MQLDKLTAVLHALGLDLTISVADSANTVAPADPVPEPWTGGKDGAIDALAIPTGTARLRARG